jgi:excisionase family DNA binding protein
MTEQKDYTVPEAAKELGYSDGTIKNWIKGGKIIARRPGRAFRIPHSEIERLKNTLYSPETEGAL